MKEIVLEDSVTKGDSKAPERDGWEAGDKGFLELLAHLDLYEDLVALWARDCRRNDRPRHRRLGAFCVAWLAAVTLS
jgi:hypothetical protein